MNQMTGEVIVAGLVTGTHIIEDIGIAVPHQIAVHIPAEQALQSKDLWRGIQQGKLFKLDGGGGLRTATRVQTPDNNRVAILEAENQKLRQELLEEKRRSAGFQELLAGLQGQLHGVQVALGRLGDAPRVVHVQQVNGHSEPQATEVVGGEVPTFLPEHIRPETAELQIRPATETAEKSNVSSATNKLREMKKQSTG